LHRAAQTDTLTYLDRAALSNALQVVERWITIKKRRSQHDMHAMQHSCGRNHRLHQATWPTITDSTTFGFHERFALEERRKELVDGRRSDEIAQDYEGCVIPLEESVRAKDALTTQHLERQWIRRSAGFINIRPSLGGSNELPQSAQLSLGRQGTCKASPQGTMRQNT
jgi:hypothetical protein